VDAGRGVGAATSAQGHLAVLEVADELLPFLIGGGPVFITGSQCPSSGDERTMAVDGFLGIDSFVAHGRVDVTVPGDELSDVGRHAVQDGVGDEDPPEVVRGEPQWLTAEFVRLWSACSVSAGEVSGSDSQIQSRIVPEGIARLSMPNLRWNSSGMGGFQTRSCGS